MGLRNRAVLGVLTYTGAQVGALARLRRGDLEDQGDQRVLRFREKGGQQREIPVRHDLDRWLEAYLHAARIAADPKETPLFRAAMGKQKKLSASPLSANGPLEGPDPCSPVEIVRGHGEGIPCLLMRVGSRRPNANWTPHRC